MVNEKGSILWGDELLLLFSRDVLKRNPGGDYRRCEMLAALSPVFPALGGTPNQCGKRAVLLVKAKMKETRPLLAGEMSGHMFFKERYLGYDDARYQSLRLCRNHRPVGKTVILLLADLPKSVSTPEIAWIARTKKNL